MKVTPETLTCRQISDVLAYARKNGKARLLNAARRAENNFHGAPAAVRAVCDFLNAQNGVAP